MLYFDYYVRMKALSLFNFNSFGTHKMAYNQSKHWYMQAKTHLNDPHFICNLFRISEFIDGIS